MKHFKRIFLLLFKLFFRCNNLMWISRQSGPGHLWPKMADFGMYQIFLQYFFFELHKCTLMMHYWFFQLLWWFETKEVISLFLFCHFVKWAYIRQWQILNVMFYMRFKPLLLSKTSYQNDLNVCGLIAVTELVLTLYKIYICSDFILDSHSVLLHSSS